MNMIRPLRRGPRDGRDAGAALLMVLMVMLVATALSLLMLGSVVNSVRPTLVARKQVRTLHAAEAGMNVVMSQIRNATMVDPLDSSAYVGDKTKLPCTSSGQVGGEDGNVNYSVTVRYYLLDPSGHDDPWRNNPTNLLTCTAGTGTSVQPKFALVTAVGKGDAPPNSVALAGGLSSGDRTAESIYIFKIDNTNAIGGAIYLNGKCLDAGATMPPASGTNLLLSTCVAGKSSQKFYWRDDLSIALTSTLITTPICIQADPTVSTSALAQLLKCDGQEHQLWGESDDYPGPYLLMVKGGTKYYLCDTNNGTGNAVARAGNPNWAPGCLASVSDFDTDQSVGSGRAGYPPSSENPGIEPIQWVNYELYGRCMNISGWNVTVADPNSYVQAWPCKQAPDNIQPDWDDAFAYELTGTGGRSLLYTWAGNVPSSFQSAKASFPLKKVCLRSDPDPTRLLKVPACSADVRMTWMVNRDTGVYDTSYTIVDIDGLCLSASPQTGNALRMYPCDGSDAQKWNAPPMFNKAKQKNFQEITGQ